MLWVLLGVTLLVILATILGTRSPNRLPFEDPYDRPRRMEAGEPTIDEPIRHDPVETMHRKSAGARDPKD